MFAKLMFANVTSFAISRMARERHFYAYGTVFITGPWIFPPFLFPTAASETKKRKTTRGPNLVFGFSVMMFNNQ